MHNSQHWEQRIVILKIKIQFNSKCLMIAIGNMITMLDIEGRKVISPSALNMSNNVCTDIFTQFNRSAISINTAIDVIDVIKSKNWHLEQTRTGIWLAHSALLHCYTIWFHSRFKYGKLSNNIPELFD